MRVFCVFIITMMVLFFFSCQGKMQAKKISKVSPSNIIFITLDAARADHFSSYGYKKNTTPCIDKISQKGVIFLNSFSPDTSTETAMSKIFFSRYFSSPIFPGAGFWKWGARSMDPVRIFLKFDDQQILLPTILSKHGYRTVMFSNNGFFVEDSYFVRQFDESFHFDIDKTEPQDRHIIPAIVSWLKEHKGQKSFIYYHIMSPHEPYPQKKEDSEFLAGEEASFVEAIRETLHREGGTDDIPKGWGQEELKIFRGLYDSNLKHADRWIGVLYDKLKELNLEDKTLIIITADHGENLGDNNQLYHGGFPWDSVVKVPLIIAYPPLIPSGTRVSGLTESIDIMPTILDICRIELPEDKSMDGESLLMFIENPKMSKDAVFHSISDNQGFIRTRESRHIFEYNLPRHSLYSVEKYPIDRHNIARQKPLAKEDFLANYKMAIQYYKKRYIEAKREKAPSFPFYFLMYHFKLTPEDIFERLESKEGIVTISKKVAPIKSWFLNQDGLESGLFYVPANSFPMPITLSASLPNATYNVSVLLESADDISNISPEKLGFRFRFDPQDLFDLPAKSTFTEKDTGLKNHFYYYLDLGQTEVKEEKISLEIDFHQKEDPYIIRHIKFSPISDEAERPVKDSSLDKEERYKIKESLRSLGYLQ